MTSKHRIVCFVRVSFHITSDECEEGFRLRERRGRTRARRDTRRRERPRPDATADWKRSKCKPSRRRRRRSAPRSGRPREPRNARRRHRASLAGIPHRPSPARARDDARYANANAKAKANDLILFSRVDVRGAMARDVARRGWWRTLLVVDGFARLSHSGLVETRARLVSRVSRPRTTRVRETTRNGTR